MTNSNITSDYWNFWKLVKQGINKNAYNLLINNTKDQIILSELPDEANDKNDLNNFKLNFTFDAITNQRSLKTSF